MKKRLLSVLSLPFLLSAVVHSQAQVFSIAAGNGNAGYCCDSGVAPLGELNWPSAFAFDAAGNYYIADYNNNRIRKVSPIGYSYITTFAGTGDTANTGDGGQAALAAIKNPYGIALDDAGNVYVSCPLDNIIRKIATTGVITTIAGTGASGYSGDGASATTATLKNPMGLATDHAGNLYIADANNHVIRKIDASGIITTVAGNHNIGYSGDGGAATAAEVNLPAFIAIDVAGDIFFTDNNPTSIIGHVRKVSPSGIISTVAGGNTSHPDGSAATDVILRAPAGIAVDNAGNMYISEDHVNIVRKVTPDGIISTLIKDTVTSPVRLYMPEGLAVDASGALYIADQQNNVIRKVADPLSVPQLTTADFTIAPNPVHGQLSISAAITITKVEVMNVMGQRVYSNYYSAKQVSIDMSGYTPGMYFVRINDVVVEKIVVGE